MNRKKIVNYRKIYESCYGKIPVDLDGRTYEIHHIDGDHKNNHPSNLKAVTLQEHYDIHYQHGDYLACKLMALQRMNKSPAEISELTRKQNQQMIDSGTHPWQGGEHSRKLAQERIANGTWHWNSEHIRQLNAKRIAAGEHQFQDSEAAAERNKKLLNEGKHIFQDIEQQRKNGIKGGKARKGYIWITNGEQSSMISPTAQIPEGWKRGGKKRKEKQQ